MTKRADGASKLLPNSIALAGEFAVLSRLALHGYDANMTLGNTKNVDILVSNPRTNRLYQLEVKSTLLERKRDSSISKQFGRHVCNWMMHKKHETIARPELWYCFVMVEIELVAKIKKPRMTFFIVPSAVVADYVKRAHCLWLGNSPAHNDSEMRLFRIGFCEEKYPLPTPSKERYEENWDFVDYGPT